MMRNMNNNLKRMDKIQQQLATGKKFQLPSDDPIGVSKSLKLNTDLSKIEQFKRNASDAASWMDVTESALEEIGTVLHRARELSVQASNGTNAPDDLQKISAEIGQLRDHLVKVANTTYAGRSVFTGFKTDAPLLDENGKYKLTNFEAGLTTPGINATLEQKEVSIYNIGVSENIEVNTVGIRLFGKIDGPIDDSSYNKADIFDGDIKGYETDLTIKASNSADADTSYVIKVFDELTKALEGDASITNPTDTIQKSLGRIDNIMEQVLSVRAEIGAKTNRVELTQNKLSAQELTFTKLLSDNEDADMAEVIMNLQMEENVYRASLSAGAKIIQPTLVDFLR